jgi:anti-anti-sigma factor
MAILDDQVQACVVTLSESQYGSLDSDKLARVRRLLVGEIWTRNAPYLIVDLSTVHSFGASFAGILVGIWDRLRQRNRQLVLCGLTPYCTNLIRILQFDKLFDIYPTQQVALEEIGRRLDRGSGTRSPCIISVRKSEVEWDPEMLRLDYIGEDGVPFRSIILPRDEAEGAKDIAT